MAEMYLGNESGGFDLVGTTNIKNIDFEEAKISKEDYENLSEEEKKSGVYLVTGLDDTEDGGGRADLISYDNTNSGLGSTNVQGAIDELNSNLGEDEAGMTLHEKIDKLLGYNITIEKNEMTLINDSLSSYTSTKKQKLLIVGTVHSRGIDSAPKPNFSYSKNNVSIDTFNLELSQNSYQHGGCYHYNNVTTKVAIIDVEIGDVIKANVTTATGYKICVYELT